MTVTIILVLAIVAVGISRSHNQGTERPVGSARALVLVTGTLAFVVIVVNAAVCIEPARNATGVLSGISGNRAASVLQLLAPVVLSIGVLWCASGLSRFPIPTATLADQSSA